MPAPKAPPGVSVDSNMREAQGKKDFFGRGATSFLFSRRELSMRSSTVTKLREDNEVKPVLIDLTATSE